MSTALLMDIVVFRITTRLFTKKLNRYVCYTHKQTDRHNRLSIAAIVQDNKEMSNVMGSVYKKKKRRRLFISLTNKTRFTIDTHIHLQPCDLLIWKKTFIHFNKNDTSVLYWCYFYEFKTNRKLIVIISRAIHCT
jgi:hypothetical protein